MNIAALKGPTGMGMAKLILDAQAGTTANPYSITVEGDASNVMAKVIAGEYDIAALPTNSAAVAYAKTEGAVQMLAINTLGTLSIVQNTAVESPAITSAADLAGKTIYTLGQGANPEYVLTHVLQSAGLTVGEDVQIEFKASADEVLAAIIAGEAEVAMLPEPSATVATVKNPDFSVTLDMTAAWDEVSDGSSLVMGCLVVNRDFAAAHPEAIAKFLEEYEASIQYVLDDVDAGAAAIAEAGIVDAEAVAKKSIPGSSLTFIAGAQMQETVEGYYEVLYGFNPQAVGGAVPDAAFYYIGQ